MVIGFDDLAVGLLVSDFLSVYAYRFASSNFFQKKI